MPGPLAGVRVVELASIGPIPFCGMVLSDMGGAGCFVVLALVRSPGAMVALAFAAAVAEAPFWPASSAAVPNLVDDRDHCTLPKTSNKISGLQQNITHAR